MRGVRGQRACRGACQHPQFHETSCHMKMHASANSETWKATSVHRKAEKGQGIIILMAMRWRGCTWMHACG
jgi:hypothetical protein